MNRLGPYEILGLLGKGGRGEIDRLAPGYTIKSIVSGPTDLMKAALRVERNVTPPAIVIEMEFQPQR